MNDPTRPGVYSDPDYRNDRIRVADVMTRDVAVVTPQTTVEEAAAAMRQRDVAPLPVCEYGQLVGLITDRDIITRSVAQGEDPTCDKVRSVMTQKLICCRANDDAQTAAELMRANHFHQLPVVDDSNHLIGIVSLGDVERGA